MKRVLNNIVLKFVVTNPVKTGIHYILLIAILTLSSCTDVIEVEVPTEAPRLVIEASINWEKETVGNNQTIKLSRSTPYFDTNGAEPVLGCFCKNNKRYPGDCFYIYR